MPLLDSGADDESFFPCPLIQVMAIKGLTLDNTLMRVSLPLSSPSILWLSRAPHRLLFFVGACHMFLAMLWWALWLISARWGGWQMPVPALPAGFVHALSMQYLVLPGFFFGFLLTVFPRWMGLPDLGACQYLPSGICFMAGQLLLFASVAGWKPGLAFGLWSVLAGWSSGLYILVRLLLQDKNVCWHARLCFLALVLGWFGLLMVLAALHGASGYWLLVSIKLGSFGQLLPVYVTVAHRMFPFFAGMALPGYRPWRPLAWLGAMLALVLLHLVLELMATTRWLWLVDLPLMLLTVWALWRWWPRGSMPGLLAVLFVGMLWLPVTFTLLTVQSLVYLVSDSLILGRAPLHALFVGFFGSILVAMVTRVTQGHSGQLLFMPKVAWFAFVAIQLVTVGRIVSEIARDSYAWQAVAALGWLLALSPWLGRIGWIYLCPRVDGKPG